MRISCKSKIKLWTSSAKSELQTPSSNSWQKSLRDIQFARLVDFHRRAFVKRALCITRPVPSCRPLLNAPNHSAGCFSNIAGAFGRGGLAARGLRGWRVGWPTEESFGKGWGHRQQGKRAASRGVRVEHPRGALQCNTYNPMQ